MYVRPVLISVPHAFCFVREENGWTKAKCDRLAGAAGRLLARFLGREGYLISADISRAVCDLNRPPCRSWPFRQRIVQWARQAQGGGIAIDVHSYASNGRGRVGKAARGAPLVLLDSCRANQQANSRTIDLARHIKRVTGYAEPPIFCSRLGDIRQQLVHEFGIPTVTLEFRDNLPRMELIRYLFAVATWAQSRTQIGAVAAANRSRLS
jgi:hypothetical protein